MAVADSSRAQRAPFTEKSPYDIISHTFKHHGNEILEIEILGSDALIPEGHLILQDGLCIGIPKKTLAKAFVAARAIFETRNNADVDTEAILLATKVLLLFDPEHMTAANFRKQHLVRLRAEGLSPEEIQMHTQLELSFLNSVLTSPLHRQSKSPTLWYHRYWLMSHIVLQGQYENYIRGNIGDEKFLDTEVTAVLKSAERHQHNYYAWQYLQRLLTFLLPQLSRDRREVALERVQGLTLRWALRHPSDVSGWSFLSFVLLRVGMAATDRTTSAIADVEHFAEQVRWTGDGLHCFLNEAKNVQHSSIVEDGSNSPQQSRTLL